MSTTIESLELEILSSSQSAESGLDKLTASLGKLKTATKGGLGLTAVAKQIREVNNATSGVNANNVSNITGLAKAIQLLSGTKISSTIGKQITAVSAALGGADFTSGKAKIESLVTALSPLSNLPKSNLGSYVNNLKKLPETLNALDDSTISVLTDKIKKLATALKPLGDEMQKVANGFSAFPAKIQKLIVNTDRLSASNKKATTSYIDLYAKLKMAANGVKTIASKIASAMKEMNDYIENINLFNASMGEYASAAREYAEYVSEVVGIDPGEWMRNQGIFMTLATGFGVVGDRANIMSQQLTQLGYDLSSFFNISVEDAMQKLQSGIAGELEPLRRLGYDLSQARLQQEAYTLGIEKKVSAMTQAEKAELRYHAIMTQVTSVHNDMARTLNAPANQLRILKAQLVMAARAIGSIFIPALNAILPYAIAVIKVIRGIAESIAQLFGFELPEVDYSGLEGVTGGANDASDALDNATQSAKKLKSYMLGFDELNVINPNEDSGSGGSGGAGGGGGFDFELPTYDFLSDAVQTNVDKIVQAIQGALDEIATIISGSLLAIGTILAVTGVNIPLGVGLMAIGAAGLVTSVALNWDSMSNSLAETLTTVTSIIGGFLLAIGAFLAFTGVNVPLGIALMAAGAVSLGTAAVINWKFLNGNMENALSIFTGIVSGALLGIGALFTFTGVDAPLGIALMAAGVVGLATAVGLNWNAMTTPMRQTLGTLEGIVGGALLALGAVLAFTGVNTPLGIALMAAGAVSLASAVALNWGSLKGDVRSSITAIEGIVGGALLGIGAILAFSGVNLPLGIGLMATGAIALGSAAVLNWDSMNSKTKNVITQLTATIGAGLLAVGAILTFSGADIPLGIALMAAGATSLGTAAALNWNSIVSSMQGTFGQIMAIAGASAMVIGLILLFTGVNVPLGLGLVLGGAASLGTAVAFNWDSIVNSVKDVWAKITAYYNTNIAPIFTADYWKAKGDNIVKGVKNGIGNIEEWCKTNIVVPFNKVMSGALEFAVKVKNDALQWWSNVKTWWSEKVGAVSEFKTNAKNEASTWWSNVKTWWSERVGNVSEFKTSAKNDSTSWWSNVKTWWSEKVGSVSNFKTDPKNDSYTWWNSVKTWWAEKVGSVSNFKTDPKNDSYTWWNNVRAWWNERVGSVSNFTTNAKNDSSLWWSNVRTWWSEKVGAVSKFTTEVKNDSSAWWSNVKTWWSEKVGAVTKFTTDPKNDSKTWWSDVKTWWSERVGSVSKFTTDAKNDSKTWWSNVKTWWSERVGSVSKFTTDVTNGSKTWWSNVKSWWSNVSSGGVSLKINAVKGWTKTIKEALGIGDIKLAFNIPKLNIKWGKKEYAGFTIEYPTGFYTTYAQGGFPNVGEMFIAREAGPELVGTIGGKTAVANNDQIVESVSAGVYQAVLAAMGNNDDEGGNTNIIINLDGEKIYENQQKIARGRGYNLGMGAFSFG